LARPLEPRAQQRRPTGFGTSQLGRASSGMYLGPLRLLALEQRDRLVQLGCPCSLITGEERDEQSSTHSSRTVEMTDFSRPFEVCVLDEMQLAFDRSRGWAWVAAYCGVAAETLIVTGPVSTEPIVRRQVEEARENEADIDAEEWYELGCELEFSAIDEARDAYRRAVELNPHHADAHVNLGRLLHEEGEAAAAAAHYQIALAIEPDHSTANFNLGVALEDLGRPADAIAAYEQALEVDPDNADAHFNLAGVYEEQGDKTGAYRHLKAYRQLGGR
jgi:tetratricopeptide (TPR) repeat protein